MKFLISIAEFHGNDNIFRMFRRQTLLNNTAVALNRSRGVVLNGPRQSGKTTLAKHFVSIDSPNYFDLENPLHESRLREPLQTLGALQGLIVIDEVQRMPQLFPILRVLMDRSNDFGQFLLLGSASPTMMRQSGESLLGRIETIEMSGFDITEVMAEKDQEFDNVCSQLWLRGGFPRSYLALSDSDSFAWRTNAINDHIRIDFPALGLNIQAPAMLRFWAMLAHYHGQIWSAAPISQSLGISENTVRSYLNALTQTLMIRQLQPWFENLGKRQVKSPKVYFRDTGFLHTLMNIKSMPDLLIHPASGASWEGFALEQVLRIANPDQAYFWATHQGAELDLLLFKGSKRIGVEFKRVDVPKITKSMQIAIDDLKLDALYIVYPGPHRYHLSPGVEAVPLWTLG
jgi:uncharacterized protein